MDRNKKSFLTIISVAIIGVFAALALTFCGGSSGGGGGGGTVVLTAEDFPNVGICATGNVDVTSDAFKTALAAMTQLTLLHLGYTSDADIPFICGKQGVWNPSVAGAFDDDVRVLTATQTISDILGIPGVFICNTGFTFNVAPFSWGFHDATTFRGEITFTADGTTYRARLRFTVTGNDAGATLASLGLTIADISLTDGSGNALTTASDVGSLFAANPTDITVNVISNSTTHITATGGFICAGTL